MSAMKLLLDYIKLMFVSVVGFTLGFFLISLYFTDNEKENGLSFEDYQFFFQKGVAEKSMLKSGWSRPERWGVWSVGKQAHIVLPIAKRHVQRIELKFNLRVFANARKGQVIEIYINGLKTASWKYRSRTGDHVRKLGINLNRVSANNSLDLKFQISSPTSPKSIGWDSDGRLLGIGLSQIRMRILALFSDAKI